MEARWVTTSSASVFLHGGKAIMKQRRLIYQLLASVLTISLVTGCGKGSPQAAITPVESPVPTNPATLTQTLTSTASPTRTPLPTATFTPSPTFTLTPTPGIGSIWIRPTDGMAMVYVPEGEFSMGDEQSPRTKLVHTVYLDAYWIDQTEVTNAMYSKYTMQNLCKNGYCEYHFEPSLTRTNYYDNPLYDSYPVVNVNWDQAEAYCIWADDSRLPTEAQWEKAARGTDGRKYPWGNNNPTCDLANYSTCKGDTTEVGSHPSGASPYGALDMAGNAYEWMADWFDRSYYANSPLNNPTGPVSGEKKLYRGGSFFGEMVYLMASNRGYYAFPEYSTFDLGFRCARSLTQAPVPPTATPTPPSTGIGGTIKYTGTQLGSIGVYVTTVAGNTSMTENAFRSFTDNSGGEFWWSLPPGSYYVASYLKIADLPSTEIPWVTCGPIEVKSNVLVKIEIILTDSSDAEMHGKPRDCGMKTP
jgi:formylglycine-generating enzyme required for sulfatase activity